MLKFGTKSYFLFLISILIVLDLAILLDIPVLRQLFGFIFLTFVPGFFLLYILKLNKLSVVEKIVLSVGLSITFLMLFGLLVNGSLLAIGYTKPLSTTSLLISFSTVIIILASIAYVRNKGVTFSFSDFKLTTREKAFLIVPVFFPMLSIVGMHLMNLTDNNVLLMLLLFMIPAYIIFISFYKGEVPEKVYPIAIFQISISLVLLYSLRSNHIIDGDTHLEYFMFLTMFDNLRWSQLGFGNLDACLSITLIPIIYQTFLNIDPEYLFKLLFSSIVSITPLVVYFLSKKYIGSFYAFLASAFFLSQIIFQMAPTYNRTVMAILFFALALWVLFHDNISEFSKKALFIVFIATIILSHYGVAWVTLFTLFLTWIVMQILFGIVSHKRKLATLSAGDPPTFPAQGGSPRRDNGTDHTATPEPSPTRLSRGLNITTITLFMVMLFFWYSQMTGPSFASGVRFTYNTFINWEWFLTEKAAGPVVQAAFGATPYSRVPQGIEFAFSWLTIIFIATGILTTMRRFKRMVSIPSFGDEKPDFLLKKFDAEYLMLSLVCCILLVATVILPAISKYYGAGRVYFQMMVPLSIFFVIGGITVSRYLKSRPYWVILAVLVPYFMCTTGALGQVFGYPRTITLSSEGFIYSSQYISDADSHAAKWLKEYSDAGTMIYTHEHDRSVLLSQGPIPHPKTSQIIPKYEKDGKIDGYIYLGGSELVGGRFITEYPDIFAEKSKIYSNGDSEIYR